MDHVSKWSSSLNKTLKSIRQQNDDEAAGSVVETESKSLPKWKVMWMKLIKEKNKMFQRSVHNHQQQPPYDEYNYSQNFDQGSIADSDEPDILSRSFSVRNCSAFEGIHTKKRNRLNSERLSHLVYVQFNSRLVNKTKMLSYKYDSLLASDARMSQDWIVEGGADDENESTTTTCTDETIRELDEDNFHSEDEP
ncbi:hypothetical protein POM88_006746 [Heracleum sosnowskyi]|uniref:Uncharacterized protein n=1 Tax=Heracleum sosnowskyi TaxID=360622 RepID=A0AAD8J5F0_9APIA|nr:hypothetical protein POM88_006746 [Heracleum sosnowskyi]